MSYHGATFYRVYDNIQVRSGIQIKWCKGSKIFCSPLERKRTLTIIELGDFIFIIFVLDYLKSSKVYILAHVDQ